MDYGTAMNDVLAGNVAYRDGWTGELIWYVQGIRIIHDNTADTILRLLHDRRHRNMSCDGVLAYLDSQGTVTYGWQPAAQDLLARDWCTGTVEDWLDHQEIQPIKDAFCYGYDGDDDYQIEGQHMAISMNPVNAKG